MKFKILKLGYKIDMNTIYLGFLYEEICVLSDRPGKAKAKLISLAAERGVDLICRWTKEELTYLNLRVIRHRYIDLVDFNGEQIPRHEAEQKNLINIENKRILAILDNPETTHCFIKKRGAYYGWGYCGYTSYSHHAGVYPKAEAVEYCLNNLELSCIAIVNVIHNDIIQTEIVRLKRGLINI